VVASAESSDGRDHDLWLLDVARGTRQRITSGDADDTDPLLSPDMTRVVFSSRTGNTKSLVVKALAGTGAAQTLVQDTLSKTPLSWSSANGRLLYVRYGQATSLDVWAVPVDGGAPPVAVAQSESSESEGDFSPDGRWVAYRANESGRSEVYVVPFPPTGAKWQVSTSGGERPHWSRDGTEILYLNGETVMRARISTERGRFTVHEVHALFEITAFGRNALSNPFDVTPDGQRFLFVVPRQTTPQPLTLVVNWPALLDR
jgi:Tol biopolymer transport system component